MKLSKWLSAFLLKQDHTGLIKKLEKVFLFYINKHKAHAIHVNAQFPLINIYKAEIKE